MQFFRSKIWWISDFLLSLPTIFHFKSKIMKHFQLACMGAILTLSGCTEEVINTVNEASGPVQTFSLLKFNTRGEGDITTPGYLYLFKDNSCVSRLDMGADGQVPAMPLSPGSYAIYAIGGEDLDHYALPASDEAETTSVIGLNAGASMGDLLMGGTTIELEEGETEEAALELQRKVFRLEQVAVRKVPDEVTKVELAISPVSDNILLNGTYADKTSTLVVSLNKGDGGTWSATPQRYALPSSVAPTIALSFTTTTGVEVYRKTVDDAIAANTKLNVEGTYAETQPSTFSATITAQTWPASPREISFDFDETDNGALGSAPVAGQMHDGYYVISVNEANKTAIVLAKTHISYTAPGEKAADAPEADWIASFVAPMASLEKPFAAIGDWRLPTFAECSYFTADATQVRVRNGASSAYLFMNDDGLRWGQTTFKDEGNEFKSGGGYNSTIYLRPVIEVSY